MTASCGALRPDVEQTLELPLQLRRVEIAPVSSETMITAASVSSESPSPARWRVPRSFGSFGFCESGRKHPAWESRLPWMSTAPSCTGDAGRKIEKSSSRETRASKPTPPST